MSRARAYLHRRRGAFYAVAWALSLLVTWVVSARVMPRPAIIVDTRDEDLIVLNGCVVSACSYMANLKVRHQLAEHFWTRLLLVRYKGREAGHAYCVWETEGRMFGYDRAGGSFPIPTLKRDPVMIAAALATELERVMNQPMVVDRAEFIEPRAAKLYAY